MPKKKVNLDVYGAIQFSERLSNTGLWIEKAEELLAAAEILEERAIRQGKKTKTA